MQNADSQSAGTSPAVNEKPTTRFNSPEEAALLDLEALTRNREMYQDAVRESQLRQNEAKRRAAWLNKHGAPQDWVVLTMEEIKALEDEQRAHMEIHGEARQFIKAGGKTLPKRQNWFKCFSELCAETLFDYVFEWVDRIILRLTWKREMARMRWKLSVTEDKLEQALNDASVSRECYVSNLANLSDAQQLIRDLRRRLSEVGRSATNRRPKLP